MNHTNFQIIQFNHKLLYKYINSASHHNAGSKYNEKFENQMRGDINHRMDNTTIPVRTKYSTRFITTSKISPEDVFLNVNTISRFNNFRKTAAGHNRLSILSVGDRLDACNVPFSDIILESKRSLITSVFVIELFLSIKNFLES